MEKTMIQLIVGIVLAVIFAAFAYRSGKVKEKKVGNFKKGTVVFVSILLAVGSLYFGGVGSYINPTLNSPLSVGEVTSQFVDEGTQILPGKDSDLLCPFDGQTATISATNKYTTLATGGTHRYRLNNAPVKTVSDAGTISVSCGDKVEVLAGNGSSTSYFGAVKTFTVPYDEKYPVFNADLVRNGSLTIEVFNDPGSNLITTYSGATNPYNQSLAAGDVVTLDANLKAQYQRGFPNGGVIVIEWNKTNIDDVIVNFGGDETNVPSIYTTCYSTDSATKAYTVPAFENDGGADNKLLGSITIDADDTTQPADELTGPNMTFYPYDYYTDEKAGAAFKLGVEDEDDNIVFEAPVSYVIATD